MHVRRPKADGGSTTTVVAARWQTALSAYTLALWVGASGCEQSLDVGWNERLAIDVTPSAVPSVTATDTDSSSGSNPPGAGEPGPTIDELQLPFDPAVPFIVNNDGPIDNWQAEHILVAVSEGRSIVGLVVNDSPAWPDLDRNVSGWQRFVAAARSDGFTGIPDPLRSEGGALQRPATGIIEETTPNGSAGALLIANIAKDLDPQGPPLVVVTGGRLTDVADAYLLAPEIASRLVVVASLGVTAGSGARMTVPNGEMDAWADTIVVERLRYVQVSAFYDQTGDLTSDELGTLPATALGEWVADKQPKIWSDLVACDQVSLLAADAPGFVRRSIRVTARPRVPYDSGEGPMLVASDTGETWLVTDIEPSVASERLSALLDSL